MSGIEILLSDHNGVYIPQIFAENYASGWEAMSEWDLNVLKTGPDPENDSYWDVWSWCTDNLVHTDKQGNKWRLWQDGDLFAICDEIMSDEEYKDFFGEERY
jgi:hypothetical protein